MRKLIDLTGKKFNRLLVLGFSHTGNRRRSYWHVICDCGSRKLVGSSNLKNNHTKSCGCLQKEIVSKIANRHGMHKKPIYKIWTQMKQRCFNVSVKGFKNYGGRGITVCKRWLKFENFYKDMGESPTGKSLERLNNNGNYEPGNCVWSTRKEQNNNSRNNHILKYKGRSLTISQWADKLKIKSNTLRNRIFYGWSTERALETIVICRKTTTIIQK